LSTYYHTDVAAGASATAATVNSPLGQLDSHLNPYVAESTTAAAVTVTTGGTYYASTGAEVSFTPGYVGHAVEVALVAGIVYANAAGYTTLNLRITDGSGTTIADNFIQGRNQAATAAAASGISGARFWVAGAGDVGQTRKAKLYLTHSVNGTVVTITSFSLQMSWR
jgi:hypothetical protein